MNHLTFFFAQSPTCLRRHILQTGCHYKKSVGGDKKNVASFIQPNTILAIYQQHVAHLQPPQDILDDLGRLGRAAQVRAQQLALGQVGVDGGVDFGGGGLLVEELEHEGGAAQGGDGVGNVLAHNVGGAAVAGLADGEALADVGAGDEAEGADEGGGAVGENVAVEVGGDDDVVGLGLAEELVDHAVDDLLLDGDGVGEARGGEGGARRGAEEAVGLGQDVGLVGDGDEGALVDGGGAGGADLLAAQGNVAGHGGDAVRGALGDALDGLGDLAVGGVAGRLLLDVEVLGVLADNDHVDGLGGREDRLDGADVGVEVELLAQGDNGRRVALDGRRGGGDGAEEGTVALVAQNLDRLVGEGGAGALKRLEAGVEVGELELEAEVGGEGLEDAAAGGDDLLADAVTGDEACVVSSRRPLEARTRRLTDPERANGHCASD